MDRDEIARSQRRRQAREALEFERERERSLEEQVEEVVAELEGAKIDEAAFARMAPEEADIVREALHVDEATEPEEGWIEFDDAPEIDAAEFRQESEEEIDRLQEEIAASRRRRDALERYIEALDGDTGLPGHQDAPQLP